MKAKKGIISLPKLNKLFVAEGIGQEGMYQGELVFCTGMSGYIESLTDPSYEGQILVFSYPLIGNYGFDWKWAESKKIYPKAIVVHKLTKSTDSTKSLEEILVEKGVGIFITNETREIVNAIRTNGVSTSICNIYENYEVNFVDNVIPDQITESDTDMDMNMVLLDLGSKDGIENELMKFGHNVVTMSGYSTYKDIIKYSPKGIIISNGPGDPEQLSNVVTTVKQLINDEIPILGICLGHQILGLAAGATTYKLKFGHRGVNQPVLNTITGKGIITTQNHGYAVEKKSIPKDWIVSYKNLLDGSIEGIQHKNKNWCGVQFHPESCPGTNDAKYIFSDFMERLK